jgi:hypothetical protein
MTGGGGNVAAALVTTLGSYRPFYYGGNDVITISIVRGRLGVFKMTDSESLSPICYYSVL